MTAAEMFDAPTRASNLNEKSNMVAGVVCGD